MFLVYLILAEVLKFFNALVTAKLPLHMHTEYVFAGHVIYIISDALGGPLASFPDLHFPVLIRIFGKEAQMRNIKKYDVLFKSSSVSGSKPPSFT